MKKLLLVTCVFFSFSVFAYHGDRPIKKSNFKTGTYGVCGCDGYVPEKTIMSLTLNEDHTFRFINNSDVKNKIDVTGNWSEINHKIELTALTGSYFNDKWKLDPNGQCIKSRKGLNFTRLCFLARCN